MMDCKPTELAIVLAALPGRYGERQGWVTSDEVRHRLRLLGFEVSSQWLVSRLITMSTVDAPWIEVRDTHLGIKEYRITQWASNDIDNRLVGVRLDAPWLSVLRDVNYSDPRVTLRP